MINTKTYIGSTVIHKSYLGGTLLYDNTLPPIIELYDFADFGDYTNETATIKTTNDGNGYWANVASSLTVAGVGQIDTTTAQDGDYCLKITNTGTSGRGEIRVPVTIGEQFTIKIWAQAGVGLNEIRSWAGFVTNPPNTTVTVGWNEYTFNVEASATGDAIIRIYTQLGGTSGEYLYVDNISIVKTN